MNRKEQKLIMILEDDEDLAEGIALSLQGEELNFEICRTISEARDVLKKKEFDLLILGKPLKEEQGLTAVPRDPTPSSVLHGQGSHRVTDRKRYGA